MEDFDVLRILGKGGFGEVFGCRKSDTGAVCVVTVLCNDDDNVHVLQFCTQVSGQAQAEAQAPGVICCARAQRAG